jgi:hypothetical protein
MPGGGARRTSASAAPDMFERLTRLELMVLSEKMRRGKGRARSAAARAGSLSQLRSLVRLANQLAQLEDEIEEKLVSH